MATSAQIAELRRLINEPTSEDPYTDTQLAARIDAMAQGETLNTLAASIWREKAATYAELVDIKEGSSDRKLSQLYKQALAMADSVGGGDDDGGSSGRRPSRTRPIERP